MKDKSFEDVEELTQIETKKKFEDEVEILDSEFDAEHQEADFIEHQESIDVTDTATESDIDSNDEVVVDQTKEDVIYSDIEIEEPPAHNFKDLESTPYSADAKAINKEDVADVSIPKKSGFSPIIIILILALIVGGGYYFYKKQKGDSSTALSDGKGSTTLMEEPSPNSTPKEELISEPKNQEAQVHETLVQEPQNQGAQVQKIESQKSETNEVNIADSKTKSEIIMEGSDNKSELNVSDSETKSEGDKSITTNSDVQSNSKIESSIAQPQESSNQTASDQTAEVSTSKDSSTEASVQNKDEIIPKSESVDLDPQLFGSNEFKNPENDQREPDVVEEFVTPADQYTTNQKDVLPADNVSNLPHPNEPKQEESSQTSTEDTPTIDQTEQTTESIEPENEQTTESESSNAEQAVEEINPDAQKDMATDTNSKEQNKPTSSEMDIPVVTPIEQEPVEPSTPVESVDTKGPTALPPEQDPVYRQKIAQIKTRIDEANHLLLVFKDRPKALSVISLLLLEDMPEELRNAITKDKESIESIKGFDQARIASVTRDLQKLIYDLPFNSASKKSDIQLNEIPQTTFKEEDVISNETGTTEQRKPKGNWFSRQWSKVESLPSDIYHGIKEDLKSLVKVEKFEDASTATLSIEEVKAIKLSAVNQLNFAQSALVSGDYEYWKSSLNEVKSIVQSNTTPDSPKAVHIVAVLDKLLNEPIATKYPIMEETLKVYNKLYPSTPMSTESN
ncbi:uroporphyrinogen-III C-methyltransferase [Taylorella equigenitalis]|uniref:uroporphyrinogen-III C-methyltransferase n=1 Tax=Taylorella equigenitalis TaxID=29575 RepID=UPI00237CF3CC|nr:uroporphyrinogen-III C-methyltransferase [Taylorella equigenitalis]WDU54272.1 hypothetical protein KPZ19_04620 [Taylorella equigenitalis]